MMTTHFVLSEVIAQMKALHQMAKIEVDNNEFLVAALTAESKAYTSAFSMEKTRAKLKGENFGTKNVFMKMKHCHLNKENMKNSKKKFGIGKIEVKLINVNSKLWQP